MKYSKMPFHSTLSITKDVKLVLFLSFLKQLEEHFLKPSVVVAIQQKNDENRDRQRHRKVKKMSVAKGSFPANMKKVLAEEAEEKALKESRRGYSSIGRVNPEHIFELCLPKPKH